jgi:hypothetical protein
MLNRPTAKMPALRWMTGNLQLWCPCDHAIGLDLGFIDDDGGGIHVRASLAGAVLQE